MDFEAFKAAASAFLQKELSIGDLLDEDDPYDALEFMTSSHAGGESPEDCMRELFEESFASQEYDDHLRAEGQRNRGRI